MTYPESVQFLYTLGNEVKTAKLGLERIRAVLHALGEPQRSLRLAHVAGTNGKGSTSAMIASGLTTEGLRTGLFTSPHLLEPTERIRVDGVPVSAEQFTSAFATVHGTVERLLRAGELDLHTTYFETVTAMALVLFRELGVQIAVVEVGLGGRLDATNVISPEVAVITPVDFDHEAFLGKSLEAIAGEKAGILKPGSRAVFARQRPAADAVLTARARELGVPVARTSEWRLSDLALDAGGSRFRATGLRHLHITCPLAGEHQVENALTAASALVLLGVSDRSIETGIAAARWPGRLERVAERPDVILDGAHNPAGTRALAAYMDRFLAGRRVWLIYGAMRDKAIAEMTGILFPRAWRVIATAPGQSRAVLPETIRELADRDDVLVAPRLPDALALARDAAPEDVILIAGSLFLVAEAEVLFRTSAALV